MSRFVFRPEIQAFKAYSPGLSIEEIKARHGLSQVVKLASNENPLGVSPVVQKVLQERAGAVFRYPQWGYPRLREAVARHLGVSLERVVCGNGSDEIIDLLVRVTCRPGKDHVLACRPCFSVYASQSRLCGVEFRQLDLNPDFSPPLAELAAAATEDTALVFVTSPDNPSGHAVRAGQLAEMARALPERTLLAVDEAYIHFTDDPQAASPLTLLDELPNIAVLRTFSKAYGLAGLRLGLGVLPPAVAEAVLRVQIPFSVNLLAEEAGMAAMNDAVFLAETLRVVREGRDYLTAGLTRLGCAPHPSQANFIMFGLPAGAPDARTVFERLLEKGIIIRPLTSYGLTDKLRVSVGREDENRAFIAALSEVLS